MTIQPIGQSQNVQYKYYCITNQDSHDLPHIIQIKDILCTVRMTRENKQTWAQNTKIKKKKKKTEGLNSSEVSLNDYTIS